MAAATRAELGIVPKPKGRSHKRKKDEQPPEQSGEHSHTEQREERS